MCLLAAVVDWSETAISCSAVSHSDPANPLRADGRLGAANGIEYAAQAMALHGALNAKPGVDGRPGFLASARSVRLHVPRLDDVAGDLVVQVEHQAGDERQAMYRFELRDDAGRALLDGRATVVLDTPLMP